ncbi:MAG: hypothetical protein HQK73_05555, partial [Desulfamplus sp.]|nr:hypothetical protein [Desulfamplus sp.]
EREFKKSEKERKNAEKEREKALKDKELYLKILREKGIDVDSIEFFPNKKTNS